MVVIDIKALCDRLGINLEDFAENECIYELADKFADVMQQQ